MGKHETDLKDFESKVEDVFSVLNSIKIISETDKFKEWIEEEHNINNFDRVFEGYRFFLECLFRIFLNSIIYNTSLNFNEDFIFYRARFVGVKLNKIPNTCEKTIFIKHIGETYKLIRKAKNFEDINKAIFQFKNDILYIFDEIFDHNVAVSSNLNISKENALKYMTMFYTYIYLNDTSKFIPSGYFVSILDNEIPQKYRTKIFEGYKYALQFVWHNLLSNKYYSTSIKNIHNSKNWSEANDIFYSDTENTIERTDLDSFFTKIKIEIITPLEKELGVDLCFTKFLYLKNKIDKKILKSLLKSSKEPKLNQKEILDYKLLWYQIEFLESTNIFNGVPAFISLLVGNAEIKSKFNEGEKAIICKFNHPQKSVAGNDFSYAVLIESFSNLGISDYSGWVFFFDCCGDYSGFAGSQYATAEMFIEIYEKRNLIEVQEIEISKIKLKEYIADKIVSGKKEEIIHELDKESKRRLNKDAIHEAKGLVLELITYYTLSKKTYDLVDWNIKVNKDQLDIILETNNSFILIDCKYNPKNMNLNDEIQKLKRKLENFRTNKYKKCEFWFWNPPSKKTIDKLVKEKISYVVLSELIHEDPDWKNKKFDKINSILGKSLFRE